MLVHDFIFAVVRHIPNKHQKLVRYYGAYSRSRRKNVGKQSSMRSEILANEMSKRCFRCTDCGEMMDVVFYFGKPPPENKEKMAYWLQIS
jgi:NAD-dependent SIR2 family protein deacetylase